jgi:hypothetical protein
MKYVERFQNIASYCINPSCTPHPSQIPQSNLSSVNPALAMPHNCVKSADNFVAFAVK